MNKIKMTMVAVLTAIAGIVFAEESLITDFSFRQCWPWSEKVDIDWVLNSAESVDIDLTATYTGCPSNFVLSGSALSGKTKSIQGGRNHVTWDPAAAGFSGVTMPGFRVFADAGTASERKYLVLNLADGTHEYLSDEPAGGWTDEYKTTKMVFRRIPAGTDKLGADYMKDYYRFWIEPYAVWAYCCNYRNVTLTSDYYISIYPMTSAQWMVATDRDPTEKKPVKLTYTDLRGATATANWPQTKYAVADGSGIAKLRARFGGKFLIDLPTEAQWEYAARAGVEGLYPNGCDHAYDGETRNEAEMKEKLSAISWHVTTGKEGAGTTHEVGSLAQNAWGLYDCVGCIREWVLDAAPMTSKGGQGADASRTDCTDPVGVSYDSPTYRLVCGCNVDDAGWFRTFLASRMWCAPAGDYNGFRLAIHLNPPAFED